MTEVVSQMESVSGPLLVGPCGARVLWPSLSATRDRAHNDPSPEPKDDEIDDHLPSDYQLAASVLAVMSPKPTVANTVTAKYSALVRVMGWLKLLAEIVAITT